MKRLGDGGLVLRTCTASEILLPAGNIQSFGLTFLKMGNMWKIISKMAVKISQPHVKKILNLTFDCMELKNAIHKNNSEYPVILCIVAYSGIGSNVLRIHDKIVRDADIYPLLSLSHGHLPFFASLAKTFHIQFSREAA